MEGTPQSERSPKNNAFEKVSTAFSEQLNVFESMSDRETFKEPADAIYGFAEFIRKQSSGILEQMRATNEYRLEQAAAKLDEFNQANAAVLHRYAELLHGYPESIEPLEATFPWLHGISVWAEGYVGKSEVV